MDIKEKRLKFLKDTVDYYTYDVNRRAVNKNDPLYCYYLDKNTGNKCAIGRHLSNDFNFYLIENTTVAKETTFSLLPEELKLLGQDFLNYIQILHDYESNWTINGLTGRGMQTVNEIINLFCS